MMNQFETPEDPRMRADPTRRSAPGGADANWLTDGSGPGLTLDDDQSSSVLQEIKVRVHRQLPSPDT